MRSLRQFGLGVVALGAITLAACGGGGDDSGPEPVTYSGNTGQATITESNAQPLSEQAFGSAGPAGSLAIASVTGGSTGSEGSALLGVATTLQAALGNIDPSATAQPVAAPVSESGSASGSCGGTMSYSISGDDATGQFAGSISFANFCEGDGTVNGSATFSGSFDQVSGFGTFSLTFVRLTFSGGGESMSMSGTISFSDMGGSSEQVTMSMAYSDNVTGKTFRVENYTLVVTDLGGIEQVSISGRFYHHDFGYVDLSTPSLILISTFGEHPHAGQLLLEGANSAVRVTFLDNPLRFTLEVDTDGNGTWDSQGDCEWDTDCVINPVAPPAPV